MAIFTVMKWWLIVAFLWFPCLAEAQDIFYKEIGSNDWDEIGLQTLRISTGELMMMGTINSDTVNSDVLLVKLTPDGQRIKWQRTYGTPGKDFGNAMVYDSVQQTLYILGKTTEYLNSSNDAMIMHLDTSGQLLWSKFIGDSTENENITAAAFDDSLGIAFTGGTTAPGGMKNNMWSGVLAKNGSIHWQRVWATAENEVGNAVVILPDLSVAVAGDQYVPPDGYDIIMGRYSAAGDSLWEIGIRDALNGGSQQMIVAQNGDLVISGESSTPTEPAFDATISLVDTAGNLKWHRFLPGTSEGEAGFSIMQPDASHFILSGYGYSDSTQNSEAFFWLTDTAANLLDEKMVSGPSADIAYHLLDDGNGWYFGTGLTGGSSRQILFVHDHFELTPAGFVPTDRNSGISVYPNPLRGRQLFISGKWEPQDAEITDLQGRLIQHGTVDGRVVSFPRTLPVGFYLLRLRAGNKMASFKITIAP